MEFWFSPLCSKFDLYIGVEATLDISDAIINELDLIFFYVYLSALLLFQD